MRWLGLALALLLAGSVAAQDVARKKRKPQEKKQQEKKQQAAHKKPTPEQIRKFKELEKKQKR